MNPRNQSLSLFLAAAGLALPLAGVRATTFTWDIAPGTVGVGNGTISGGNGTWNTSNGNWTTDAGANNVIWGNTSADEAIFGGTAGTVTINTGTGVTANKLTLNSDGYVINGNVAADVLALAGTTPTVTVPTAGQTATINAIVAGSGGFTKSGSGTLVLNGANSYTGNTILSGGTLVVGHVDALSTQVTGSGGANLRLATDSSVTAFSVNTGTNNSFTITSDRATSGAAITHVLGAAVLGGGSSTVTFAQGSNVTSGTAGISLTSLSLSAGISAGGSLTTTLNPTTATVAILGTVTRTGATTGSTKILALSGSIAGNSVGGSISNLDVDDIIAVTKSGSSTWTLNDTTSNYTGITTITAGVLEAAGLANGGTNSSIGASTNAAANLVFGAATATLRYIGSSNVTINRGFTTSTGTGGGATVESSGTGTLALDNTVAIAFGTVDQTRTITLGGTNTGNNTFSKTLSNNGTAATGLNKTGSGTWIVNGSNSFTGATNISGGTLVAGNVGALTTSSAVNISTATGSGTLRLATDTSVGAYVIGLSSGNQGTIISDRATSGAGLTHVLGAASVGANTINIQSGGNVSSGTAGVSFASLSLASGGGGITRLNPVSSVLTITGAVNSTTDAAKTLELGGTSTGNAISGVISNGTNVVSLAKSNTSTWTLDGAAANTYTGTTSISGGTLVLGKAAGVNAIPGSLTIGDGAGNDIVQLAASNQIADSAVAALIGTGGNAGILRLNNQSETIGGLSSTGGAGIVENGNASAGTSTLTLNVASGTQTFSGTLQNNGGSGSGVLALTKSGSGTQVLSGPNTYTGATTVSGGLLRITNGSALGTTAAGTTVVGAATLEISGGISTGESLTLQGNNTASSANQLVSVSGNNWIMANISTTSGGTNHSITSLAGKLTIDANISPIVNGTRPLYLRGAGDGEITGGFNQGTATTAPLIKEGPGTWTLSGASSYNGSTTVAAGVLALSGSGSINNTTSIVLSSTGSELDVTGLTAGTWTLGGAASQILSGVGSLDAAGKTVQIGGASTTGTVAPGASPGILSIQASTLQFGPNGILSAELTRGTPPVAGSTFDQIDLTGGLSIDSAATLNLSALGLGTWTQNDLFFLVANDGADAISGSFSGFGEGSTITFDGQAFKVTYQADSTTNSFSGGNDFALQVIPEPVPLASLLLALLFPFRRARRGSA